MQDEPALNDGVRVGRHAGDEAPTARAGVAIGFGSPANDTGVTRLDLNDILVKNSLADEAFAPLFAGVVIVRVRLWPLGPFLGAERAPDDALVSDTNDIGLSREAGDPLLMKCFGLESASTCAQLRRPGWPSVGSV